MPPGFPSAAIRKRNADLFIGRGASEAEAKEVIRAYLASISWADWNLGRVIGELDRLGLRDNTIIVFRCRPRLSAWRKRKMVEGRLAVRNGHARAAASFPRPARTATARASPRIVESLDIYPTLVELCGLPKQNEIEGASLAPLAEQSAGGLGQAGLQHLERGWKYHSRHRRAHGEMALRRVWQGRHQRRDAVRSARRPARNEKSRRTTKNTNPLSPNFRRSRENTRRRLARRDFPGGRQLHQLERRAPSRLEGDFQFKIAETALGASFGQKPYSAANGIDIAAPLF